MRREYAKTLGCAALLFALNAGITPLLFHTGHRQLFPLVSEAVGTVVTVRAAL